MATNQDLPRPLSLFQSIGPSFILLGLALGSGELILWPYLTSRYGLGLIWGGLLGISLQYFLNTEVMRYTLARGESVFVGWRRLSPLLTLWFIISSFIPWILPGIVASSGAIFHHLFPLIPDRFFSIVLLVLIGIILTLGKTLYKTMSSFQAVIILFTLPFIVFLVFTLANSSDYSSLLLGLLGRGEGWWFFPPGVAIGSFLGAFAYSGAGGNLNLAQSYYIKEKGMGMGKYGGKISSLFTAGPKIMHLEGSLFRYTKTNLARWKSWWRLVLFEHGLIFWGLGFFTIAMLATLSYVLTRGGVSGVGLEFLYAQSDALGMRLHPIVGSLFLFVGSVMLFSTQLGVFESASRIISENIILLNHKEGKLANPSLAFYLTLWLFILLGILYLIFVGTEPRLMVTLGAIMNAAAMMVAFPLIYFLNKKTLPPYARPGLARGFVFVFATCFFAILLVFAVRDFLQGIL